MGLASRRKWMYRALKGPNPNIKKQDKLEKMIENLYRRNVH